MAYRSLPGPKGDTGPMGDIIWKGAWSAETTYAADDAVTHGGSSYMATDASTDVEPGVDEGWEDYWDVFAVKGAAGATWWVDPGYEDGVVGDLALMTGQYAGVVEQRGESGWGQVCDIKGPPGEDGEDGSDGTGFTWRESWMSSTAYVLNDVVEWSGSVYICILAYSGGEVGPETDTTHWSRMVQKGDAGESTPINLGNLPSSDPEVAGAAWNNDGTLDFSAGT